MIANASHITIEVFGERTIYETDAPHELISKYANLNSSVDFFDAIEQEGYKIQKYVPLYHIAFN